MTAVAIQCPRCSGSLQIDSAWAGQQVTCPLCQGLMAIPAELGFSGAPPGNAVAPPPLPSVPPALPPECPPPPPPSAPQLAALPQPLERSAPTAPSAPAKRIVLPTPDGGSVTVEDRPKVIRHGRSEVVLRQLAGEEKSSRRFWKNLILWTGCVLLLLAVCYFLWRRG